MIKSNCFPCVEHVSLDDLLFINGPSLGERIEIWESGRECLIEVDVVGLKKDGCKVLLQNDILILEGEKWTGGRYEALKRCIELNAGPGRTRLKSDYQSGILRITVPLKASGNRENIAVKV